MGSYLGLFLNPHDRALVIKSTIFKSDTLTIPPSSYLPSRLKSTMKFFNLALLSLLAAAANAKSDSNDLEGEAAITTQCGSDDIHFACEWGANGTGSSSSSSSDSRKGRKLRGGRKLIAKIPRRELFGEVYLADVVCVLEMDGVEYEVDVPFPEGWTIVETEADDADDYYAFSTTVTIPGAKSPDFVGALEVELLVGEDDDGDDVLVYDDSAIGVSC